MRGSQNRPSAALWAIGAFVALLITGATALMFVWDHPQPANEAHGEPPIEAR